MVTRVLVWLPQQPAHATPAQLAQQAISQLPLPAPQVHTNPAGTQLVNLPTWLWISNWATHQATAGVPGLSVTANATPNKLIFHLGDGTTLTCPGPGTPYLPSRGPAAQSPTCGHTYTRSSASQPDGTYAVTVSIVYTVTWAGGGQFGTVPDLIRTTQLPLAVAESQAIGGL